MWDGPWSHAEAPPEEAPFAPPATRKPTSYKPRKELPPDDFPRVGPRATKSLTSATSGTSELPAVQRAARLGDKLSKMAEERPPAAWSKLQEEFEVQKLVWQSVGMVKGKEWVKELAGPQSMVERALHEGTNAAVEHALEKGDPGGCANALLVSLAVAASAVPAPKPSPEEAGDREVAGGGGTSGPMGFGAGCGGDVYSNAIKEAMQDVLRQERATDHRHNLAERLRLAAIPASLPRENTDKKELEALVAACHLADDRLERLVRKTLLLPIPIELGAAVTDAKKSSGLGSAVGGRSSLASNGSIGAPVTAAALSGSLGTPVASAPIASGRLGAEVSPTVSGPYVSLLGLPEPLTKEAPPGAVPAGRRGSGPKPKRAPLAPQVQTVSNMKF